MINRFLYLLTGFFLLSPLFSLAQSNCQIKKAVDPYTKEVKLTTGFIPINAGTNRVLLSIDANKAEVDFFFSLAGAKEEKCFDAASTALVTFEGTKSKATFKNTGSMNCEGLFHFTFRNSASTPAALQRLGTQRIVSITLTGNNKTVTVIPVHESDRALLMEAAACLANEAKTLLQ
jgi:hypothetical protein